MNYKLKAKTDSKFSKSYENYMLKICEKDKLLKPPHVKKHGIFHNRRPWEHEQVFKYGNFNKKDIVLDTGAMHTYFCIYLAQFVKKVYTTDDFSWADRSYLEKEKLFSPKEWSRYVEKKGNGKIKAESANIMHLPYKSNSFDKVLCISTIEHVSDDLKGIRELARVLKKGGKLLLTTEFNFLVARSFHSYLRVYNFYTLNKLILYSGLKLIPPILIESDSYVINPRKFNNVFVCLEK